VSAHTETIAQLKAAAELAWSARWQMSRDMNHDDVVNLADFRLLASWLFFAPGDALLLMTMIYATPVVSWHRSAVAVRHRLGDRLAGHPRVLCPSRLDCAGLTTVATAA
jgi:hypothetical protein